MFYGKKFDQLIIHMIVQMLFLKTATVYQQALVYSSTLCALILSVQSIKKVYFQGLKIWKLIIFTAAFLSKTDIVLLQVCGSGGNGDC